MQCHVPCDAVVFMVIARHQKDRQWDTVNIAVAERDPPEAKGGGVAGAGVDHLRLDAILLL